MQYSVKYATDSKDSLQISLSGDLKASVEVVSWPAGYTTMSARAKGTLISVSGYAIVTKNDVINEFKFSGTEIKTQVEAKIRSPLMVERILWTETCSLFDSWSN